MVGDALNEIAQQDPDALAAGMEVMETEQLIASGAEVDVLPNDAQVLVSLGAAGRPAGGGAGLALDPGAFG